jgi:hypothetical protein
MENIKDQVFDRLTAIKPLRKNSNRSWIWECRCSCGNTTEANISKLKLGLKTSCGCKPKENIKPRFKAKHPQWKGVGEMSGSFWCRIKACAKNRKIPFDLTQQEAWDLFLKQERRCALSGVTIAFAQNSKDLRDGKNTASIDRIDSNKPYTISNVQWVHYDVNYMKHWLSTEYFVNWCRLVVEHSSQHKCSLESV